VEALAPEDPRTAGEFRLSARLGHGGMGQVFLGYSPAGRAVAVKMCHPELASDPSFVQRFAREATAAQAVNGLYTAQVVAAGPYDRPPWMATAYVPGPSLTDYVYGYGPLPEVAAWRLAGGLAEALVAVHACGLVHRDLKPSNVLLAVDGPRVIDFGISSALEVTGLTTEGSVMGSPPYMSPEQAMGEPSGPASDVFSLGSTVAFAAVGAPPFGDGDAPGVLFRVVHTQPQIDRLPPGLRELVAACLAKDPAARPTLAQLLRAVQDATAGYAGSAGSFWPGQVTSVIVSHQASPASPGPFSGPGASASQGGPHPQTVASAGVSTFLPPEHRSGGQAAVPAAGGIGRRRLLFGAGGVVVAAGLAVAGYELTSSGGKGKTTAGKTAGPAAGTTTVAWTFKADGPVQTGAVISEDGGTVGIASDKGTVYLLDAKAGTQTKAYSVGGTVSGLTTLGGTLLAGSADGKVHALLLPVNTPQLTWTSDPAGGPISGSPSSDGSNVYAGSKDHDVYAFNEQNGQLRWKAKTGGTTVVSKPTGTGIMWAASADGNLYVLSTDTGKVLAKKALTGTVGTNPVVATGQVYLATSEGVVYNIGDFSPDTDKTIGDPNWSYTADGPILATPVVTANGQELVAATTLGTVYGIGPGSDTGTKLWSYRVGGAVRGGLAVYNSVAYAGCDDGNVYAIDITSHELRWKFKAGAPVRGTILATADGLVYFGTLENRVYAVHA
jgi:outer membrane protein assembly factor BamB